MLVDTLFHIEIVELAKVLSEEIIAMTINAAISPYSMAVAPERSSRIALRSLFVFTVHPRTCGPMGELLSQIS
jgi:hypothetical protein